MQLLIEASIAALAPKIESRYFKDKKDQHMTRERNQIAPILSRAEKRKNHDFAETDYRFIEQDIRIKNLESISNKRLRNRRKRKKK